jgi:fumarylpyruvate hydrolase
MIWSVPEIIAEVSRFYRLGAGDLIFTGTPAGVGPVVRGDRLVGRIGGLEPLEINIGASMP